MKSKNAATDKLGKLGNPQTSVLCLPTFNRKVFGIYIVLEGPGVNGKSKGEDGESGCRGMREGTRGVEGSREETAHICDRLAVTMGTNL